MATDRQLELIAEDAAEKAAAKVIHEFFKLLGVDTNDVKQINELRNDIIWAHEMRKLSKMMGFKTVMTLTTLVVPAIAIAAWEGLKHFVHK